MIAMYAVVKTGGKQYRVAKDDTILVEKLDAEEGQKVTLSDVMLLGEGDKITVGTPVVANASVEAQVVSQTRGPKIIIFRRKRRKNHRRTQGHRQDLTLLKITDINTSAKKSSCTRQKSGCTRQKLKTTSKKESKTAKEGTSCKKRPQRRKQLLRRLQPQKGSSKEVRLRLRRAEHGT